MNIRTLVLVIVCSFSSVVAADFIILEEGVESSTSDIRLPGSSSGFIVLQSCAGCDALTLSLSDYTQYSVNDQDVSYSDFLRLSLAAGNSLNIYYDPASKAVTRMRLRGPFSGE